MRKSGFHISDKEDSCTFIKKLLILGTAAITFSVIIKNLVNYYMETMQKTSNVTGGQREYTAAFENKEYKPGCPFKGGGLRSMFSRLALKIDDLNTDGNVAITCNAIFSRVEITVPKGINVVTIDISKLSTVQNSVTVPYDSDKNTLNIYISGFMSAVIIKNA